MPRISGPSLVRNGEDGPQDERAARAEVLVRARALMALATSEADASATFIGFEKQLVGEVFALARAVIGLFLVASERRVLATLGDRVVREGVAFRRAPAQSRNLLTWFGVVRYRRTYLRQIGATAKARGFHPLDAELGLLADRLSPNLLSIAVRLATRVSFSEARDLLAWFLPIPPSTEVIESAVLGYGRHTQEWFETAPAPADDGDVLILQIDSKGVPTATEEELRRRRGKRARKKKTPSPRHRGRQSRERRTKKARRKKGDKSKHAKMGTMVVMYTLRRRGTKLLGPIHKRYYASFAPKRHAFEIARREATKRGFPPGTSRMVQLVTDGDNDLARYAAEFFPEAIHTIDVMHVVEKLWEAASSIHRECSPECRAWVETQKDALYGGRVEAIVAEFDRCLDKTPKTGPGNKYRREKLSEVRTYLAKRRDMLHYDKLLAHDLELGTGAVEGAIKNLIHKRMDHGGMRWIKERAEALLQLRCIDANGDWDAFAMRVHEQTRAEAIKKGLRPRLQRKVAAPLPSVKSEVMRDAA